MTWDALPELEPLAGGRSGETFATTYAGERAVVRLYVRRGLARGPQAAETDAAVLRMVRGVLPVPEVLECRAPDPETGAPGLLVTAWLPGERADLLWRELDAPSRVRLGSRLGELAGRMALMVTPRGGPLVGPDLRILPVPEEYADLGELVLARGDRLGWGPGRLRALADLVVEAQSALDGSVYTCLVHGGLDLRNVLVDPTTLEITGVLDWEHAHSGTPYTDLGRVLRDVAEPSYAAAAVAAYRRIVPRAPQDLLELARAADLVALLEPATRTTPSRPAKDRLLELVRAAG